MQKYLLSFVLVVASSILMGATSDSPQQLYWMKIMAKDKVERGAIANVGVTIEHVAEDFVSAIGTSEELEAIKKLGNLDVHFELTGELLDYPNKDEKFHNYEELVQFLNRVGSENSDILSVDVIGQSIEGRDIFNVKITHGDSAGKPEIVFMGGHHAREHLSVELPIHSIQYIVDQYRAGNERVVNLVKNRVINMIPIVNPDGAEHDIATGKYQMWRKNRSQDQKTGIYGVDLNRNYGYKWATVGSSANPRSQTYHGPEAFSEPETKAIRDFVVARPNLTILTSFHTFSELILYPWGHKYESLENARDLQVHEVMAQKMSTWNNYEPQQSSDLYPTSGDTTDWSYGEHGLISFTFELDPKSLWEGGFYPGQSYIDVVFQKNIEPILYLIDHSDNPYRVLEPIHAAYGLSSPLVN